MPGPRWPGVFSASPPGKEATMPDPKDGERAPPVASRRGFLQAALGTTGLLLLSACGGATQPAAPKTEAKPTEAPKPAEKPAAAAAKPTEAAKPAAEAKPAQQAPAAKAPVSLKGTSLSVLQWQSFVPDADPFFKKQIEEGFMKDTGAQVTIEFVNANDLQPKIAASIQSGSGPDIVQFQYNWQHIYKEGVVDVTDLAEEVKQQTGDFFPQIEAANKVDGKYLGVPHDFVGNAVHWRKSWFTEVGADRFPATFAEYHAAGKKLKDNGHPLGQALGHSFGDPPTFCYPLMWAHGGREVDEQGKVAINSPETIAAVTEMQRAWRDAYDETGLAWDDTSNNRAFLAGTVAATLNGASAWWVARKDNSPFFDDIALDLLPPGPKGRFLFALNNNYAIMKYSRNVDAAKEFIRWSMTPEVWYPWFELSESYYSGVGPKQDETPIWDKFPPVTRVFKGAGPSLRAPGSPGPYNQQAGLAQSKYIIVDMFAKAVQGETPEAAVAWAENELKQVYT
jgi:multiple sugar transport system substrate-binding protein